jgi:hypothetical protein
MRHSPQPTALDLPEADISGADLEHARAAYRGSLEAARAQRAFLPSARHEDTACWSMLGSLFAEPGLNRTELVRRVISRARASGYIVDQPSGRMVRYFLSRQSFNQCLEYYRAYMSAEPHVIVNSI